MIRHIHIGSQIDEDADAFAFFDTITARFVTFGGQQVFDDDADLDEAADGESTGLVERCKRLRAYRQSRETT